MEAQLNLALSDLQQLLRKRKYKATFIKLERMLGNWQIRYYSPEMLINLLLCQASTLNKLLQRNLFKKYKYNPSHIQQFIQLLTRNLSEIHELLCQLLEEQGCAAVGQKKPTDSPTFPLVKESEVVNQIKLEKLQLKRRKGISSLQRYVEDFVKLINTSTINVLQTLTLYKQEISWREIQDWLEMPPMPFCSLSGLLSQAKIQLLFSKFLSLEGKQYLEKAQSVIERATDQFIDCIHQTNIKSFQSSNSDRKQKKYANRHKECYKLLTIALIMSSKNNMKLGLEQAATVGCDLVRSTVLNLGHGFGFFKRMLQPQLYLFDQFFRYRAEKKELNVLVSLYFPEVLVKLESATQIKASMSQNPSRQEINSRRIRPSDPRSLFQQISTVKTISLTNKRKGNSSMLTGIRNNSNNSFSNAKQQMGDTILTKMIIGHIEEQNSQYETLRKNIGSNTYYKKVMQKSHRLNNSQTQKTLKKQKISQPSCLQEETEILSRPKCRREGQQAKQRLKSKAKMNVLQNSCQEEELPIVQLEREVDNCKNMLLMRLSQQKSFCQDESEIKRNVFNLGRKTKIFVDILFQNRGGLGIRKIVEKFQLLKKKEEQKQKMTSNRITSSTNRDRGHVFRNMQKFKVITEEILRMHLDSQSLHSYANNHQHPCDKNELKKLIEANYTLGQDSIDSIKVKLLGKMNGKEKVKNQSQIKQEMFKQKLKQLGSTNFFLKRAPENKSQPVAKRLSASAERKSRVSFYNEAVPLY